MANLWADYILPTMPVVGKKWQEKPRTTGTWGPTTGVLGFLNPFATDYGYTEAARSIAQKPYSAEVTTTYNNPDFIRKYITASTAPQVAGYSTEASSKDFLKNQLTGGDYGGDYGGDSSGDSSGGTSEEDLALRRWLAELEAAKSQARLYRGQAQSTFQSLMDAAQRYRQRAEDLFKQSAQEIVNSLYENAGAAGRTGEAARKKAILQARAGGYGASSRMGLLNDVTGNLASTIGSLLARKGEQEAENLSLFQGRQGEAASQEKEAEATKNALEKYADEIEGLGIQNAFTDYASQLNNILQNLNTLRSIKALTPEVLTSYTPNYGGLVDKLNTIMGTLGQVPQLNSQNVFEDVNIENKPLYQDLLRRLGYRL